MLMFCELKKEDISYVTYSILLRYIALKKLHRPKNFDTKLVFP